MECKLYGYSQPDKHGLMPNGQQRYFCPECKQTLAESFDTRYSYRDVSPEQMHFCPPSAQSGEQLTRDEPD